MDGSIKDLFELSQQPMLAVEDHKIVIANTPALRLFGRELAGEPARRVLPPQIFSAAGSEYICSTIIKGSSYSACVRHVGETMYVYFSSDQNTEDSSLYLSEQMMNSLLSSLNNINAAAYLMGKRLEPSADEKLLRYMAVLRHNYFCLHHNLLNLDTLLKLDKGQLYLHRRDLNLALLCSGLVSSVSHLTAKYGVELDFSTAHGELNAELDHEKTERIILNILSNCYAHSGCSRIVMRLERSGNSALISIDDNGCGIPQNRLANLFSRWEPPLGTSPLTDMATGKLGLKVARGLAQAQDGALVLSSVPGSGTSVRILLPLETSGRLVLRSETDFPPGCGMHGLLSELAWLLDDSYFEEKYTD